MSTVTLQGYVRSILPFSSVDGPGNRTIIFLQGCGFRCGYCHNPETIPQGNANQISSGEVRLLTAEEVVAQVMTYSRFLSGVTLSGGECTQQPQFLLALCAALKAKGLHVLIDTNGDFDAALYEDLRALADGFMLDVKSVDPEAHRRLTGRDNACVLDNLQRMAADKVLHEVRTVIVPAWPDNRATVAFVSRLLAAYDPNVRYKLIRFRPHGVTGLLKASPMPEEAEMKQLEALAKSFGLTQVRLV